MSRRWGVCNSWTEDADGMNCGKEIDHAGDHQCGCGCGRVWKNEPPVQGEKP